MGYRRHDYLTAPCGARYPRRCQSLAELDGDELPYDAIADAALPRHIRELHRSERR